MRSVTAAASRQSSETEVCSKCRNLRVFERRSACLLEVLVSGDRFWCVRRQIRPGKSEAELWNVQMQA